MFRARLGVRTRILAIALVPSLTLLVVGVGAAGYLVDRGSQAEDWAIQMQRAAVPTRELMEAVQQERLLTLAHLAGDESAVGSLATVRPRLDAALINLEKLGDEIREVDDEKVGEDVAGFNDLIKGLTGIRTQVDSGQLPAGDAYIFYNRLLDVVSVGSQIAQQSAPDAHIAIELAEGLHTLYAAEAMSRSNALALALVIEDRPAPVPMDEFLRQIGYYHNELTILQDEVDAYQRESAAALTRSAAWQQLSEMENAIAQRNVTPATTTSSSGVTRQVTPPELPMDIPEWQAAATEVNRALLDMWIGQNKHTQNLAEHKANESKINSLWGGLAVLVVSSLAFVVALLLANRIIGRLKRLRRETLALADEQMPDMMRRLQAGEQVDAVAESPVLDYGHDEIGQVARAFQKAHAAAVTGAIAEARTREGVKAVFLNIAHRSQIVVHRQLEILDEAEHRQEDPALLETLFRLDHLATRERRNAENLIILGGGRPGRQWRNPVALIDLVRSAIGETLDYTRVRVSRLPEVSVAGTVVADLIHLIAELVDNATAFSPPQSRVEVHGNMVGKGVVVEIDDQGMGMPEADVVRMNEMLRTPPDFGVAALSADSRLGLFVVAQLAGRHGISVRLVESDYGGIRAIVLVPSALIVGEYALPAPGFDTDTARRRRIAAPPVEAINGNRSAPTAVGSSVTTIIDDDAPTIAEEPQPRSGSSTSWGSSTRPGSATNGNGSAPTAPPNTTAAPPIGADGRPALPRRSRQANLAPELAEPAAAPPPPPERPRSAEQARDLMSAIENGTRQGRRPVNDAPDPTSTDQQEG